jgi:putative Mg2+ transporter-C (MgtC) family protein
MPPLDVLLLRILLTLLVGGVIGAERELRSKQAGFRTMILICLGSFLFTTFSIYITDSDSDRIASNIVTGIGFLGAGVIYKSANRINGITTAATIWAVAALGMGIADGFYTLVLICTGVILIALLLLSKLESWFDHINKAYTYRIVSEFRDDLLKEYEALFSQCGLKYKRLKRTKNGNHLIGVWLANGTEKNHNRFTKLLLKDPSVKEFEF